MPHTEPNLIYALIIYLTLAIFTSYYANQKGKNPFLWFIISLLIGILALLILLFLPSDKNKTTDNGMPTMTVLPPDPSHQEIPKPSPTPEEIKERQEEDKLWYYLDVDHQQMGPVSIIALRELWNRGQLELNSYVWSNGMAEWEKVDHLPELKKVLNKKTNDL